MVPRDFPSHKGGSQAAGDIVAPGAFSKSLAAHKAAQSAPAMLWHHDPRQPIGKWLGLAEDAHGLKVEGKLTLGLARARDAHALAADGIVAEPTKLSPLGLRLASRQPLSATRAHRDGLVEIQDEGSQLAALFAAAKPGEQVVDRELRGAVRTRRPGRGFLVDRHGVGFAVDRGGRRCVAVDRPGRTRHAAWPVWLRQKYPFQPGCRI